MPAQVLSFGSIIKGQSLADDFDKTLIAQLPQLAVFVKPSGKFVLFPDGSMILPSLEVLTMDQFEDFVNSQTDVAMINDFMSFFEQGKDNA